MQWETVLPEVNDTSASQDIASGRPSSHLTTGAYTEECAGTEARVEAHVRDAENLSDDCPLPISSSATIPTRIPDLF